jgi:hypothetical protein
MIEQNIDVFNGDADGLCALVQLRRQSPKESTLVTGVKRDISLLKNIADGKNTQITVLDISFEKNAQDVARLLEQGANISYFDHHKTGDLIKHDNLQTHIDLSADTCTSLIVNEQLQGKYLAWAITAAFGDNLTSKARSLALEAGYKDVEIELLKQLGTLLNYNGYGASLDDFFFAPAELYKKLSLFDTPFEFVEQDLETFKTLSKGYSEDMSKAAAMPLIESDDDIAVIEFPNEKWARRVSGVWANELANRYPDRAHAILTEKDAEHYLVSIRAPLNRKIGADELASQFPTGGGRKAAAGINALAKGQLNEFISAMKIQFKT